MPGTVVPEGTVEEKEVAVAVVQAPALVLVMERVPVPVMERVLVPETLEDMARVAAAVEAVDKVMVQALDMGLGRALAQAQATATVRAMVVVRAEVMGVAEAVEAAAE
ncbi:hypothetical protein MUK42_02864 [Musa troglodytarum]|uniref:Uncharacterized protein n=1 Tax=Musa troglodytarum TaxID=320322 RepID=A0A9E7JFN8_9LILI|nr:hypothetical protein MUK42_02864 [Musa troglodytarum]